MIAKRFPIWLIVLAALMPLLFFVILQFGFAAREQRRAIEGRALNLSEQLIIRADGEIGRIAAVLNALELQAVSERDWATLRQRYFEFAALYPDLRGFAVRDFDNGELLLAVGLQPVQPVLVDDRRQRTRTLFVGYARQSGCNCLMFERLGPTENVQRITLTMLTESSTFLKMLPLPGDQVEVAAFNGPDARFIARSVGHKLRFATMSSTYLQAAVASGGNSGIYRGVTLEGIENYTAFTRSAQTSWTAHVALGSSLIDEPARRFLTSLGVAGALSLLLAMVLILFAMRQMRQARAFAEKMQQVQKLEALGQLTGGLAHDFNNLLTPVIGTLDQLSRRDSLDDRGRRLAAGALTSAQRAAKLTSQLLAFSRLQKLNIVLVPVHELVANTGDLIKQSLGARNPFEVNVDPTAGYVTSDRTQLEVALLNLALNARDASPAGSPISLHVRRDGGDVLFEMKDCGIGMDEATRSRALEPFFTTKPTGQGTGLGLAQVFGVVAQSCGTMTIESRPSEGTTVTLSFPACEQKQEQDTAVDRIAAATEPLTELRVLVVDDDAAVRSTLVGMLAESGHLIESVASGASALYLIKKHDFDLVLADYLMPGMTGVELIRAVRKARRNCRFLLVSGFADTSEIATAGEHVYLLAKPFTASQLRAAVAKASGRQSEA